jgi:hypothetical protein
MEGLTNYSAEEICAMLTTRPIPRYELLSLQFDFHLRSQVTETLSQAGYELVDDPISDHYDARIKKEIFNLNHTLERELGSMNLTMPAKALIAILWCSLILPKYDRHFHKTFTEETTITEDQLYENFKEQLGSKTNLKRILTTLKQFGFIETVRGEGAFKAGPRLSTAIDSTTMYDKVKGKMIEFLVNENDERHRAVKNLFSQEDEKMKEESDYESAS